MVSLGVIREGTGVRNTRERLHHLYGDSRQRFALTPAAGGGTIASVMIPFDTDDGPPATFTTPALSPEQSVNGVRRPPTSPPAPVAVPARAPTGGVVTLLRVLIVDDEAFARQRLRRLLTEQPDVEIVGEAANGREADRADHARTIPTSYCSTCRCRASTGSACYARSMGRRRS